MEIIKYLFLAFVQGMTEFLPVSSSGHLVFFQKVFGFKESLLSFDIFLHLATMLSVVVFLRREIIQIIGEIFKAAKELCQGKKPREVMNNNEYFRLGLYVLVAMVPTAFFGFGLHALAKKMFSSLLAVAFSFFITGCFLFLTKFAGKPILKKMGFSDALLIGLAQGVAVIPGISRSGATISCGLLRGLEKKNAALFSFLLSVPTIFGAALADFYPGKEAISAGNLGGIGLAACFAAAFIFGYLGLSILYRIVVQSRFYRFAYYCWGMAIFSAATAIFLQK